jgi:arogenate dehydrogenase (NADP+), plant
MSCSYAHSFSLFPRFSVPSCACLKRPTPLDVLLFKKHPRDLLLPEESGILCTHLMVGPESGKDGCKDLTFMYDKVRICDEANCSNFHNFFANEVS